jgi:hypothetical protein
MTTIDRIIAKVQKITGSAKTRNHVESLVMAAYEAGRKSAITDIRMTLEDDTDSDHTDALEVIEANF